MNKKEILEICLDYLNDGVSLDEIAEWVEENTDLNSAEIINKIYKIQVFGGK